MRRCLAALAALLMILMLSGCSAARQVEGQAFAVTMAVDEDESGMMVSVQVPSLGGAAKASGEGDDGGYVISSAAGADFETALNLLNATIPRMLNLSQIKSLIVAEKLARREDFGMFLRELKQYHLLYGEAGLIICQGSAREMLEQQKPLIGVRLSDSVVIALEQYSLLGTIPRVTLATVLYATESVYEDPIAVLAAVADKDAQAGDYAGSLNREGDNLDEYYGGALLKNGSMVGRLSGGEMQLMNLLRGAEQPMAIEVSGIAMNLERQGAPRVTVDLSGDAPMIEVKMTLLASMTDYPFNPEDIASELARRYADLTAHCQSLGVDPFGYARVAAAQFLTIPNWVDYDWHERFRSAHVDYAIALRRTES